MSKPFFDVIVCTYESGNYLKEQISSILSQEDCRNLYIFDDSKSNSIRNFLSNNTSLGSYIKYNLGPQKGVVFNFLNAITRVDSDILFLSDQDDIWVSGRASLYTDLLDNDIPHVIFSDSYVIDSEGDIISNSFFDYQGIDPKVLSDDSIFFKNCVQGATICMNRKMIELIKATNPLVDFSKVAMHDWWIALLAKYYGKITFLNEKTLKYRQHGANLVGARPKNSTNFDLISKFNNLNKLVQQMNSFYRLDECLKQNGAGSKSLKGGVFELELSKISNFRRFLVYACYFFLKVSKKSM